MPDINEQIQESAEKRNADPELDQLFSRLEEEYRKFNSNLIVMKNKIEQSRIETLRRALDMMRRSGIDPNSPEQVNAFMEKLSQIDPDLLTLFESSMNGLLSGEEFDLSQVAEGQQPPIEGPAQFQNLVQQ